jgi:mRNA interferase MazF
MAIQRGEIYFVDLDTTVGREQAGVRPCVVVSSNKINAKPLVVTVILGTKGSNVPHDFTSNVRVPADACGLPEETVFMAFQIRAVDHGRFPRSPSGRLPDDMQQLEIALRYCCEL